METKMKTKTKMKSKNKNENENKKNMKNKMKAITKNLVFIFKFYCGTSWPLRKSYIFTKSRTVE